ncbi:MAG: HPr family phosphocarrier protein [Lachnospiraceae bacterium]|nr:HPr family phosphocarrier protein [Lachnospiraceae bacterium]
MIPVCARQNIDGGAVEAPNLMWMGIKCGDEVTITAEGVDEDATIEQMEAFMKSNL